MMMEEPHGVVESEEATEKGYYANALLPLQRYDIAPKLPPQLAPTEWDLDPDDPNYVPRWFSTDLTWVQWSLAPRSPITGSSDLFTLFLLTEVYKKYYQPYSKHSSIPPHPLHNFYGLTVDKTPWKWERAYRHPLNLYIWDEKFKEKFFKENGEEKWEDLKARQNLDYNVIRRKRKGLWRGFETVKAEEEEDRILKQKREGDIQKEKDEAYDWREKERKIRAKRLGKLIDNQSEQVTRLDLKPLQDPLNNTQLFDIPVPDDWMSKLVDSEAEIQALIQEESRRLSFKPNKDRPDVDMTGLHSREPSAFPTTPAAMSMADGIDSPGDDRPLKRRKLARSGSRMVSVNLEEEEGDGTQGTSQTAIEDDGEGPSALKHKVNRSWWGMVHRIPGKAYLVKDNFIEHLMLEDWSDKPHLRGDNLFPEFKEGTWDMEHTRIVGMDENWWWGSLRDPDLRKREVWANRRLSRGQSLVGLEPEPSEDGTSANEPEFDPGIPHSMVPVFSNGQYMSGTVVPFSTPRIVPLKQKIGEALGIETGLSEKARRGEGTAEELRGRKAIYSRRPPGFESPSGVGLKVEGESSSASTPASGGTNLSGWPKKIKSSSLAGSSAPTPIKVGATAGQDGRPSKKRKV